MKRLQIIIRGRVQGVFYRASTRDEARQLGLHGWVRNLPDGSVEVLAEGPEVQLLQLLRWCRQGPPAARVDQAIPAWDEPRGELGPFEVRY